MKKYLALILLLLPFLWGCPDTTTHSRGVYMLLDTSGTYKKELKRAEAIINYLLGTLQPGDSMAVARIDSGSFSEKDIVAKMTFDKRPSVANQQKRLFKQQIDDFVQTAKGSCLHGHYRRSLAVSGVFKRGRSGTEVHPHILRS
jgi:hypothetical protein